MLILKTSKKSIKKRDSFFDHFLESSYNTILYWKIQKYIFRKNICANFAADFKT